MSEPGHACHLLDFPHQKTSPRVGEEVASAQEVAGVPALVVAAIFALLVAGWDPGSRKTRDRIGYRELTISSNGAIIENYCLQVKCIHLICTYDVRPHVHSICST